MTDDIETLRRSSIYPGHPVTVALIIIHHYDSMKAALGQIDGTRGALQNGIIPGAGGNVYAALDLLKELADLSRWTDAFKRADTYWHDCDGQGERDDQYYQKRYNAGQNQADELKVELLQALMERPDWYERG